MINPTFQLIGALSSAETARAKAGSAGEEALRDLANSQVMLLKALIEAHNEASEETS